MSTKCEWCNKKKMVTMTCTCGMVLCLLHHSPFNHKCERILNKTITISESDKEATGAFKKIDKI